MNKLIPLAILLILLAGCAPSATPEPPTATPSLPPTATDTTIPPHRDAHTDRDSPPTLPYACQGGAGVGESNRQQIADHGRLGSFACYGRPGGH